MEIHDARRVIKKVAKQYGVPERTVVREIEFTIRNAIEQARAEGNTGALQEWSSVPCAGDIPNAYEAVAYLAEKFRKEYNM